MMPVEFLKPDYPRDAFEGTAEYYSRFRVPYPTILFDDLIKSVTISKESVLVDLACGPGRVTFPLAKYFDKVIAADIDSGMVDEGKRNAVDNNIRNIDWINSKAEELNIEQNSVDLITIGDAFDRLDQSIIFDLANNWLKPGGSLAVIGMYSIWRGNESWHILTTEIVDKWVTYQSVKGNFENYPVLFGDKGFTDVRNESFEFIHSTSIDSILGYLYSTSRCSKKKLGNNAERFEKEIREELGKLNETGLFNENIKCGFTLGKKALNL